MKQASSPEAAMAISQNEWTHESAAHFNALFALANGLVGVEGSIDERAYGPDCYLPDAYVSRPISYHESFPGYATATDTRIKCPSAVSIKIAIDGEAIHFESATISHMARTLDLATGQLHRKTLWTLKDGRSLEINVVRIVPLNGRAIIASRMFIRPVNFSGEINLTPVFGAHVQTDLSDVDDPRISGRLHSHWTECPSETDQLHNGDTITRYRHANIELAYYQNITGPQKCDGGFLFDRVVEISCARDAHAPVLSDTILPDFDSIVQQQQDAVDRLWTGAAITIDGDEQLEQAIRFNLFQLHQSACTDGMHSIAAKGLSGEGYEGHYFWDTEVFMLPVLALQAPEKARSLIRYRISKLDAARRNAQIMGHNKGALFPWRTIAGAECSSHYPTGAAQYHINGDIAHGIALYADASGDEDFRAQCAELLFETCRIWMEIGAFDPRRKGAFCIYSVTGPDEYSALVDNDFYTNAIAKQHLEYAANTAAWLKHRDPDQYATIAQKIALQGDEIESWQRAADAMWISVDPHTGVSPQDDTFLNKPYFPALLQDAHRQPLLLNHHPLALFRHRICKQGNVIQAMSMDLVAMPRTLQERNLAYYEPITTHDSTLSAVAFAIVSARLDQIDAALSFHHECAFVDLKNLHSNTSHGLHMAALAGSWLVLAQGWGGMVMRHEGLSFRPILPVGWRSYRFRVNWRGSIIEIHVNALGAEYSLIAGDPIKITDHGRVCPIGKAPLFVKRPAIKGVIFDLDGVLTDTAEDHYQAWHALAENHGLQFSRADNEQLKGVDRSNSLKLILSNSAAVVSSAEFDAMLDEKNAIYCTRLKHYTSDNLFSGVTLLFQQCRDAGLKIGLASASRNAQEVIARLGIADQFDCVADAALVSQQKPAPDIFLACAAGMGLSAAECVGVEDANAGITAIHAAGMMAIGIGSEEALPDADVHVPVIGALGMGQIFFNLSLDPKAHISVC